MQWQYWVLSVTAAFEETEQLYSNFYGCSYRANVANAQTPKIMRKRGHEAALGLPFVEALEYNMTSISDWQLWF